MYENLFSLGRISTGCITFLGVMENRGRPVSCRLNADLFFLKLFFRNKILCRLGIGSRLSSLKCVRNNFRVAVIDPCSKKKFPQRKKVHVQPAHSGK